ncbi:pyrroloquinoline quinone biosynthesis protein PqqF [Erwinia sp.]|uniref:pyrroloquinoline quinone biosynthesis protein PqqF n=1 Tax=Erwinia citreus TaxID=558 RepID=UPI003C772FA5
MSQAASGRQITLANGLRVNLLHDPSASRAAALLQLSAGSHEGPEQWPGLAHLLEHVLFAGSAHYQGDQRLMAWGPANGARLNATTHAHHTAWFFDIAVGGFEQGLLRLVDMLARPLLTLGSIAQEVKVIDAEFQMLTRHTDTLCEVALSQAVAEPHRLHDFHVGNLPAFGTDTLALQQALREYHQRFFRADKLALWLQGPQSLEALAQLAEQIAEAFSPQPTEGGANRRQEDHAEAAHQEAESAAMLPEAKPASPLTLTAQRHYGLHSQSACHLQLSFVVSSCHRNMLSVFSQLLTDKAEHSLLATLRDLGLGEAIQLLEPYRSQQHSLIGVRVELCEAANPASIEAVFSHWLKDSASLSSEALAHYARLARRHFAQLSGLDQLRARAFGFTPPESEAHLVEDWQKLLTELQPAAMTRLWVAPSVNVNRTKVQGFTLEAGAIAWGKEPPGRVPKMAFYSPGEPLRLPELPAETAPLTCIAASGQPLLLLHPLAGKPFSRRSAALIEAALQPVIGLCQHHGGELSFAQRQGIGLIQLSGSPTLMQNRLAAIIDVLSPPSAAVIAQGERLYRKDCQSERADIAIRVLLARLPEVLTEIALDRPLLRQSAERSSLTGSSSEQIVDEVILRSPPWQATLYGGESSLQSALSQLLSGWPAKCVTPGEAHPSSVPQHAHYAFPTASKEAAVLLFCPLTENRAECLAAWQVLASLFEPRFFQKLRVELNIGYVVSCRFHQSAGVAGILFALQSPTQTHQQLSQLITDFIADMVDIIDTITEDTVSEKTSLLLNALPATYPKSHAHALNHWQQMQLTLPPLSADIFAALSVEKIQQYYSALATEKQRWYWLNNSAK